MSESQLENNPAAAKQNIIIAYSLMIASLFMSTLWAAFYIMNILWFFGTIAAVLWVAGAAWSRVNKNAANNTVFESHYKSLVTTFWWGLGLTILGILSSVITVGFFIMLGVYIWTANRVIKGLLRARADLSFN